LFLLLLPKEKFLNLHLLKKVNLRFKNLQVEHGSGAINVSEVFGIALIFPQNIKKEKVEANIIKLHRILLLLLLLLLPLKLT
jgi:hypothetical protein